MVRCGSGSVKMVRKRKVSYKTAPIGLAVAAFRLSNHVRLAIEWERETIKT